MNRGEGRIDVWLGQGDYAAYMETELGDWVVFRRGESGWTAAFEDADGVWTMAWMTDEQVPDRVRESVV